MRMLSALCLNCLLTAALVAAVQGTPKKPYVDLPDDKPREQVEPILQSPGQYEIQMGGMIDGAMTRMPIGYAAFVQGWQPNRSVLIENVGTSNVENPRITVGGKRNWHTVDGMVAEATRGYTTPADRARAIWEFRRRNRFHACTWDAECSDAIKSLNVYGYTLCGNEAHAIRDLWRAAGLTTRHGYPIGHCICEVRYDGAFHLLDADEHVICLKRDNKTIASAAEMVRDHDLIKRTHTYGIGRAEGRKTDEFSASLYVHEGKREGDYSNSTHHAMDLTLRPGESIEYRWDHIGKDYSAGKTPKKGEPSRDGLGTLARFGKTAYDNLRNGKLRYRPDLTADSGLAGAESVENVAHNTGSGTLRPKTTTADKPAMVTWRLASPYVFVGGKANAAVRLGKEASAQWEFSTDQQTWQTLASLKQPGEAALEVSLDEVVSPRGKPNYCFWLRLVLQGDATAEKVAFDNDIQMAPLSLPELELGTNRIVYTDSNEGDRRVRITHRWMQRTAWHPPAPPAEAVSPKDGETVSGSRLTFRWSPASDPDGDKIVDYHFELSEHAEMRWPLSPNFEKLISLTPSKGTLSKGNVEWTVPCTGLLNPQTYYWRVRALDATGVWGPWSRTFKFAVKTPCVPLDLRLEPATGDGLVLHWRPNPAGERPVSYKVYGSNERGFSASDSEYLVFRGKGFVKTMDQYTGKPSGAADAGMVKTPANLVGTTSETRMQVVGPVLAAPNTNRAFYRVVAVDAAGNESGPSDYVAVPRPFVANRPVTNALAGKPYHYQPQVIRSIGDLRCRRSKSSSYNAAFWDRDELSFAAKGLPAGLAVNPKTGQVSGIPTAAGSFDVVLSVTDQSGNSQNVAWRLTVK